MVAEGGPLPPASGEAGRSGLRPALKGILGDLRRDPRMILTGVWYASLLVAGTWLILRSSPWGIGVRVDSFFYLTAADGLSQGKCLCWLGSGLVLKPLVHFGPVYPSVVALVSLLSPSLFEAARFVTAVLFGANLVLAGLLVHISSGRFWAGVVAAFLFGASRVMLLAHDSAMSEPLFLFLLMGGLLALTMFSRSHRRLPLGIATAACAAALLTRYAGGAIVIMGMAGILFLGGPTRRSAARDAAVFAAGALLPLGLWLARNYWVAGTPTNRTMGYTPVTLDDARKFLDVVTSWVTPVAVSHWIQGAGLLAFLALAAFVVRGQLRAGPESRSAGALGLLLLLYILGYIVFVVISRMFLDPTIPIDDRMLTPLYAALSLLVAVVAAVLVPRSRWGWAVLLAGLLLTSGSMAYMIDEGRQVLARLQRDGVGMTSRVWQQSDSLRWVRGLPPEALLYSNRALFVQFLLGREAYQLPERFDPIKREDRPDFLPNLERMYADLERPNSYLLMFDPVRPMDVSDVEDEFTIGMVPVLSTRDGVVFQKAPSSDSP